MVNVSSKRIIPICFKPEQVKILEQYARSKGALTVGQAIEKLLSAN
jgi:hypothetical protein